MNKQFEEYIYGKYDLCISNRYFNSEELFKQLPTSMQWGVYLEFFDSVGINPYLNPCGCHKPAVYNPCIVSNSLEVFEDLGEFESLTEAQQAAIKKAFELLDE